jgi:hypothetical protein
VTFKITRHIALAAPADALTLLWPRLEGVRHDDMHFSNLGGITATMSDDPPLSMTRDEWSDTSRRTVLGVLSDLCEEAPELEFDWYAVGRGE